MSQTEGKECLTLTNEKKKVVELNTSDSIWYDCARVGVTVLQRKWD